MGSKLKPLIEEQEITWADLKNRRIAIDGTNMLFQILYNPIQMQKKLPDTFYLDRTQRVITHLYGWLQKITAFYKANLNVVVVFDGKPDPYKRLVTKNIAHDFRVTTKKYNEARKSGNLDLAKHYALSKNYMWLNCIHESKKVLECCGIPVIMAPSEAEAQCVSLQLHNQVDYVVSNDYDTLLFGATEIIRNLTFQSRKNVNGKWKSQKGTLKLIHTKSNLQKLNISQKQLIDLSILLGNDYFPGIAKIGPKKALDSIKLYGKLEPMIEKHPTLFKELSISKIAEIRSLFLNPEVITYTNIKIPGLNLVDLRHLLLKEHHLNSDRVEKYITRIEKYYQKYARTHDMNPERLEYDVKEIKAQFNIHLQRRLDRAKKKADIPQNLPLSFIAANSLEDSRRKKKPMKMSESSPKKS